VRFGAIAARCIHDTMQRLDPRAVPDQDSVALSTWVAWNCDDATFVERLLSTFRFFHLTVSYVRVSSEQRDRR
jgi:hypothetical protein